MIYVIQLLKIYKAYIHTSFAEIYILTCSVLQDNNSKANYLTRVRCVVKVV